MMKDAALEEIWEARRKVWAPFGKDTKAALDHFRAREKEYEARMLLPARASRPARAKRSHTGSE